MPPEATAPAPEGLAAAAAAGGPHFTDTTLAARLPPLPSEFPPLPELQLPQYTLAELPNGLRVFLLEDHEVPLVRGTLLMRGGQHASPADKVGLATISAGVQRAGGSTAHPAPQLDERLEALAAYVETGAGQQAISGDFQCLAEDTAEVLGLFAEVVRSPALQPDKLSLYQSQVLNGLEHQNDSPGAVSRRKAAKLVYGPDSIYARTPTPDMIKAIGRDDVAAYLAKWERPDAAVLGVVGDFSSPEMMRLVEQAFGSWAPAEGQPAEPPVAPRAQLPAQDGVEGRVYLVDRPGLTQASVVSVEPGIQLSDPDAYPLDVLGSIFNSFGGRLFDTLRSREGLAYSVSGGWDSPLDHAGLFIAGGQTSAPGDFLKSLRTLLASAAAEAPPVSDLDTAKQETLNSFVFNFASPASQLQRILAYDLLGLPQDYLFRYKRGVEAVDTDAVLRAAAAHLHPERQTVVVTGDGARARANLEAAGFEVLPLQLEDA